MKEIIIIGSGLAGLSAAIKCAQKGQNVVIVSAQPSSCSQSVMAAGGINAVLPDNTENDTIKEHENDTIKSGCYLADAQAVHNLAENAPHIIEFLEQCGVVFSRDKKGAIAQRYFGGQQKKRTCYSNSNIGKQLMSGLEQRVRYYENKGLIRVLDHHLFLQLVIRDDNVLGAVIIDRNTLEFHVLKGPVIIASGGLGGLFKNVTGTLHSDGTVTAALYEAGVRMSNLEMIQYHPTTIQTRIKNMLISEAARGEGGRLFAYKGGQRWYFCEEWFGENGNLMPRDIVSRAIYKVIGGNEADPAHTVWLDITSVGKEKMNEKLKEVREMCIDYLGIDPVKEPIPVVPAVHYFMGGIYVDVDHRASLHGLYAAGECCAQYHGANRLGGNSTLGAIYGGQCAAESACSDKVFISDESDDGRIIEDCRKNIILHSRMKISREEIQKIMQDSMGIIRNEQGIREGLQKIENIKKSCKLSEVTQDKICSENIEYYQNYLLCGLSEAMLMSADQRKESRGAHYRSDYPQTNDKYTSPTIICKGA